MADHDHAHADAAHADHGNDKKKGWMKTGGVVLAVVLAFVAAAIIFRSPTTTDTVAIAPPAPTAAANADKARAEKAEADLAAARAVQATEAAAAKARADRAEAELAAIKAKQLADAAEADKRRAEATAERRHKEQLAAQKEIADALNKARPAPEPQIATAPPSYPQTAPAPQQGVFKPIDNVLAGNAIRGQNGTCKMTDGTNRIGHEVVYQGKLGCQANR